MMDSVRLAKVRPRNLSTVSLISLTIFGEQRTIFRGTFVVAGYMLTVSYVRALLYREFT
ncbi:MAG: hypothetical protein ACLP9D_06390 [Candidatus Bathyarchaeia archaeon]